jgi:hypothetical protein
VEARRAYYSLDSVKVGFPLSFTATVDWDSLTNGQMDPTRRQEILPVLRKVHFNVVVTVGGSTVVPESAATPSTPGEDSRAAAVVGSTARALESLIGRWRFLKAVNIDPTSDYRIEDLGTEYQVRFKGADVRESMLMNMSHAFVLKRMTISDATSSMTVLPNYRATDEGLLLVGFKDLEQGSTNIQDSADIRYAEINGVRLPTEMIWKGDFAGHGMATVDFSFSNYQFTQH